MSLNIHVETVPHDRQRYPTVGDWNTEWDTRQNPMRQDRVRISDMGNADFEFLVALHELVEMHLCHKHLVDERAVTAFDVEFEKNRQPGDESEPGDAPAAPYYTEHQAATIVERVAAFVLGVDWNEYDKVVREMP